MTNESSEGVDGGALARKAPHEMNVDVVLVHSDDYANWVFDAHHPTQGRRFMLAREMLLKEAQEAGLEVKELPADFLPERELLHLVHTPDYVDQVLIHGTCNEWSGSRTDLGALAQRMAGGSFVAVQALLEGQALTAVNFAGAKHHAMACRPSNINQLRRKAAAFRQL